MSRRLRLRLPPILLGCLMLAACGSHHESASHRAARGAPPASATQAEPRTSPATGVEALPKAEVAAAGESVSSATFTVSPIARAVAAAAPDAAGQIPARWVENKNYDSIVPAQPVSTPPDMVEVVEVFWYGCPHCYHLDPPIEDWRSKSKPAYAEFRRMPVIWPGDQVKRDHARLYFVIEALGKLPTLHSEVFREIHERGNPLVDRDPARTESLQKAFLMAHGVSGADFDRTYRAFSVEAMLQQAEQFTQRYRVISVPRMIVGGKYAADVATAGGETELFALLNDLAAAEHKR